MRMTVFGTRSYDEQFLVAANSAAAHELRFLEPRLTVETAALAIDSAAICAFVNDNVGSEVLELLADQGVRLVALRSAGYNHVDLTAAQRLGIAVVRVPSYSPHAVAEHCVGLILALNRRIHRAYNRVREGNFSLDGLLGFDLNGKTVGVIGTGSIGARFAQAMLGFGCEVVATDPYPSGECRSMGVTYLELDDLLERSRVVSLHCPLTPDTHHLIDQERLSRMREGVMLINTSRGALIDTTAVIAALKTGRIGHLGLDVYEEESDLFFEDLSEKVIHDDVFSRLLTFPNVLITGHQAFFTEEAMRNIAATTISNLTAFECGEHLENRVTPIGTT